MMNLQEQPHRRYNPLTDEWVLVSPHRTQRPWQGKTEKSDETTPPAYDPACYLCPGNPRAGGAVNPKYRETFTFVNDFSALLPDSPGGRSDKAGILIAEAERGICKVICFTPRHDLTVALMDPVDIRRVLDTWVSEYLSIGADPRITYVQIFENRGAMMGASNPHPHCQVWANEHLPLLPARESGCQAGYRSAGDRCLLCEYVAIEERAKERIVHENDSFLVVVPFWAVWPFETMILPREHLRSIDEMSLTQRNDLAGAMKALCVRYDNLFSSSFPYSMGIHQKPTDGEPHDEWHFHLHYFPPLLRSAEVRKFMVGYEMLGTPQRDITAEGAADRLRSLPERHYTHAAPGTERR